MPDLVTCQSCTKNRSGWCTDAVAALLHPKNARHELGRALAEIPQRCPAHKPARQSALNACRLAERAELIPMG